MGTYVLYFFVVVVSFIRNFLFTIYIVYGSYNSCWGNSIIEAQYFLFVVYFTYNFLTLVDIAVYPLGNPSGS